MSEALTNGMTDSGAGRYAVRGPMEFANAAALLEQGIAAFRGAPRAAQLTLDLQGVGRIDSAGLAVLMQWLAQARGAEQQLIVVNAPAKLLALARVSQLDKIISAAN